MPDLDTLVFRAVFFMAIAVREFQTVLMHRVLVILKFIPMRDKSGARCISENIGAMDNATCSVNSELRRKKEIRKNINIRTYEILPKKAVEDN